MKLILLHLSDLHITEDMDFTHAQANHVASVVSRHSMNPQNEVILIIVSGDITFSGKMDEYMVAVDYFTSLRSKIRECGIEDITFVFVPGNHDVDFGDSNIATRKIILKNMDRSESLDTSSLSLVLNAQSNFWDFMELFSGKSVGIPEKKLIDSITFKYNEKSIGILLINSSWNSTKKETTSSLVADQKIFETYKESSKYCSFSNSDIRISILHHPYQWFEGYSEKYLQDYLECVSDMIIFGHEHQSNIYVKDNFTERKNYYIHGAALIPHGVRESAFNLIELDLENMLESLFCYYKGPADELYDMIENPVNKRKISIDRYRRDNVHIKKEFYDNWINDLGYTVHHKYANELKLDDIFVVPDFGLSLGGEKYKYLKDNEYYEIVMSERKIIISGDDQYGKTTILKDLYKYFLDNSIIPLYIQGEKVKIGGEDDIRSFLESAYKQQYEDTCLNMITQSPKSNKVILIDDFDAIMLSKESLYQFYDSITNKFDYVIITSKDTTILNRSDCMELMNKMHDDFAHVFILESGKYVLNKLVRKWLRLNDAYKQVVDPVAFDSQVDDLFKRVLGVQNESLFEHTILSQLTILSILNSDYDEKNISQYAHVYKPLITLQIVRAFSNDQQDITKTLAILAIAAYRVFVLGENNPTVTFDEQLISDAIQEYYEGFGERMSITRLISVCVDSELFVLIDSGIYKFKYNYVYYYFVAQYLYENSIDNNILYDNIHYEPNANILLLLSYEYGSRNNPVFGELIRRIDNMYSDYDEYDFQKINSFSNPEYIKNVIVEQKEIASTPGEFESVDENRSHYLHSIDESDKRRRQLVKEINDNDGLELVNDLHSALKTLNIISEILKNYSPQIKREIKEEAIIKSISLIQRITYYFSIELEKSLAGIQEFMREKISEDEEVEISEDSTELMNRIIGYLSNMWERVVYSSLSRAEKIVDNRSLIEFFQGIKNDKESNFYSITSIAQKIKNMEGHFPISDIESFLSEDNADYFSKTLLNHFIFQSLKIRRYDYREKQKVLALINNQKAGAFLTIEQAKHGSRNTIK